MTQWKEWPTQSVENRLLAFLQECESRIAALGILDVRQSVADLIDEFCLVDGASGADASAALENLIAEHSVIRLSPETVRSAVSEMVRLLRLVRQRFANHRRSDDSSPLVRDLVWAPVRRQRPRRDLELSKVLRPPSELRGREHESAQRAIDVLVRAVDAYVGSGNRYLASGFQLRAFDALLSSMLGRDSRRGHVIAAGTGAGKTHAFLFPAMVAALVRQSLNPSVAALCIYNRTRLAVNQFQDFVNLIHHVNRQLKTPVTIGIDFGEVPYRASDFHKKTADSRTMRRWSFLKDAAAWQCPWANCPLCDQPLVVPSQGPATFRCQTHGEFSFIASHRDQIAAQPPTFYVATGASLHNRLQDSRCQRLFGTSSSSGPGMLMFDEIHLYEGVEGIQSALLARRVRRRIESIGGQPAVVGLSATIADSSRFFAEFTGLPSGNIDETAPEPDELQWDGVEHFISIKAEPDEEVSPLSTTIQAAMVLGHHLPQPGNGRSRVFCFTDSLDRVGRWAQRLNDAERNLALFDLRSPGVLQSDIRNPVNPRDVADPRAYAMSGQRANCQDCIARCEPDSACPVFQEGECWFGMTTLGTQRPLSVGIQSSRTTRGLETADLLIATSSLEVGYDDSRVRGILQYLAPSGPAAFTQRKGRAGRPSDSHTFVVTVLSPHRRRDEFYFRNLHLLTDPTFERIPLNFRNRVLTRAHALHLLLDRAAQRSNFRADNVRREDADTLQQSVEGREWSSTLDAMRRAFDLDDDELGAIVDDEHAGTLRVLLPRLVSAVLALSGAERFPKAVDLVGGAVPSDLLTAAASEQMVLQPATGDPDDAECVDVMFGLAEASPGNVRYRYDAAMWIPLIAVPVAPSPAGPTIGSFEVGTAYGVDPTLSPLAQIPIDRLPTSIVRRFNLPNAAIALRQPVRANFSAFTNGGAGRYRLQTDGSVQETQHTGRRISDRSTSHLARATITDLPTAADRWTASSAPEVFSHPIASSISAIEVARSNAGRSMTVRRFAIGVDYALAVESSDAIEGQLTFRSDGSHVALGHSAEVDALRFIWCGAPRFRPNAAISSEISHAAFRDLAMRSIEHGNLFERTKVVDALSFFLSQEVDASERIAAIRAGDSATIGSLRASFAELFEPQPRTLASFNSLLGDAQTRVALADAHAATVGAADWSQELADFTNDSLAVSLAAALTRGIERVLTLDLGDATDTHVGLVTDGHPRGEPQAVDLFELSSGGMGTIDLVARRWRINAGEFWVATEEVVAACPTARRQLFFEALASLDATAAAMIGNALGSLRNATSDADSGLRSFRSQTEPVLGSRLEDPDIKNLLQLVGRANDPQFEFRLLLSVTSLALAFRQRAGRWATTREIGVLALAAAETNATPKDSPLAVLASNLATWIDPQRQRERYRRTFRSQVERRYVHSCEPACPSCLGLSVGSGFRNRALLCDYFDQLAASSRVDATAAGALLSELSKLWKAGHAAVRVRYPEHKTREVAEMVAEATAARVPGRHSDIEVAASSARVRGFTVGQGYTRELGLHLGPRVV